MSDDKHKEDEATWNENSCPTSKQYYPSHPCTPTSASASSSILKEKNENVLLCPSNENNLPSKCIADLWQLPLKFSAPCKESNDERGENLPTPSSSGSGNTSRTGSTLPPTKLVFSSSSSGDSHYSLKLKRRSYRRSSSYPESCSQGDSPVGTPVIHPKRLKLGSDENSPFEDLCGRGQKAEVGSSTTLTPVVRKLILKSQSDSLLLSTNIKSALERIESNPDLIGDGSKVYALPIKRDGKHPDLKEISQDTLVKLIEKSEEIPSGLTYKIIDCRYPYEYEGGHIRGALNLYTKTLIHAAFMEPKTLLENSTFSTSGVDENLREIVIFHCEFSSQRGPLLCRYLRDIDRAANSLYYPSLFYPELYVLFGGYKEFYENFPHHCDPPEYVPMAHPEYSDDYRKYKLESKIDP